MRPIAKTEIAEGVNLNVKLRFSTNSQLRFLVFAYNAKAAVGAALPDVAIQIEIPHNGSGRSQPIFADHRSAGSCGSQATPLRRGTVSGRASEQRAFEIE
jgi:hypothetical protein